MELILQLSNPRYQGLHTSGVWCVSVHLPYLPYLTLPARRTLLYM
jgi:hypothetical protein